MKKVDEQALIYLRQQQRRHLGYYAYQESRKSKPTKKPEQILRGLARKNTITDVMDVLRDWRLSQFENEASCRHGLRSAFCLQGYGWVRADREAQALINAAITFLGYQRPTWEQGQRAWTDSPDFCSWCQGPIDEDTRSRGQRFCSVECARISLQHLDKRTSNYAGTVLRSAYRLIAKDAAIVRQCEYCGDGFKSDREDARFCSTRCVSRWQKGDNIQKDIVCSGCGKVGKPAQRGSLYCTRSCQAASRLAVVTRQCECCGESYSPAVEQSKYCSKRCAGKIANRMHRQRNRAEHHLTCHWCNEGFVSKMPWATLCGSKCKQQLGNLKKPAKRPRQITPQIFDYVLRMAA